MSTCYIEYLEQGQQSILALSATTEVNVVSASMVPKEIVEAGYEVSQNVINNGFVITFSGIISSTASSGLSPQDFLNKLYALRDSKGYFRLVVGDQGVLTNTHDACLFTNISRVQNGKLGIIGDSSSYKVSLTIFSVRLAELSRTVEPDPLYADLLAPKKSRNSNTKQVNLLSDEELMRMARASARNELGIYGNRGDFTARAEEIFEDYVKNREALSKAEIANAKLLAKGG